MTAFNRVQKIEAQAVTDVFSTVFTVIAETEACLKLMQLQQAEKAATTWIRLQILLVSNSLTKLSTTQIHRFNSSLSKLDIEHSAIFFNRMKRIEPYSIQSWAPRLQTDTTREEKDKQALIDTLQGIIIAMSASVRNGMIEAGEARLAAGPGFDSNFGNRPEPPVPTFGTGPNTRFQYQDPARDRSNSGSDSGFPVRTGKKSMMTSNVKFSCF